MHRTQILLEEQQYIVLRHRAQREGKSLGELIRDMIEIGLRESQEPKGRPGQGIASLKGLIDDAGLEAKDHDRILYGRG